METVIEVKNLKRVYVIYKGVIRKKKEIIHAVKDISFSVGKGEIFGLLGQNGAGKTTILFKLKQDEFMQPIPTIGEYAYCFYLNEYFIGKKP